MLKNSENVNKKGLCSTLTCFMKSANQVHLPLPPKRRDWIILFYNGCAQSTTPPNILYKKRCVLLFGQKRYMELKLISLDINLLEKICFKNPTVGKLPRLTG